MMIGDTHVFLTADNGTVRAILRAATEADWAFGAYYYGLINSDGMASPGVHIDPLGPVMVNGTPDTRYHVNLMLVEPALSVMGDTLPRWQEMVLTWSLYGQADANPNAEESAVIFANVGLIDADSINSPARVWL